MFCWFSLLPILLIFVHNVSSDDCGRRATLLRDLISHGRRSTLGLWPWHAAVLQRYNLTAERYTCGGSIISDSYILTAAHCAYSPTKRRVVEPSEILVLAGISSLQKRENSLQQMRVAEIAIHETFDEFTSENNIALLKLYGKLNFTNYVKPICLWTGPVEEELIVNNVGYVPGWGSNDHDQFPDQLQYTAMPIVSRGKCRDSDPDYYTGYLFERTAFCAGFRNGTPFGAGYSGGGLYIKAGSRWMLRGIVSNGKIDRAAGQLDPSEYIVFTDVAYFKPWIDEKMRISGCGQRKVRLSSVNRENESRLGEWPWHAAVMHNLAGESPIYACRGTIIANRYIVTVAHCLYTPTRNRQLKPSEASIQTGITNRQQPEQSLQQMTVAEITIFDGYDILMGLNDIALLKLSRELVFTDYVKPICLWRNRPEEQLIVDKLGYIPGWGQTKHEHVSNKLKNTVMLIVSRTKCIASDPDFYTSFLFEEKALCAGFHNGTLPAMGIAGGGLYVYHDGKWILQGIISSGKFDAHTLQLDTLSYLVFTDVTSFLPWIKENMEIRNDETTQYL